jgi:hypothetical protein
MYMYCMVVRFVQARTTSKFNYYLQEEEKSRDSMNVTCKASVIALVGGALYKKALQLSQGVLRSY